MEPEKVNREESGVNSIGEARPIEYHIRELAARLKKVFIVFLTVSFGCLTFGYRVESMGEFLFILPYPSLSQSVSVTVYGMMVDAYLPPGTREPVAFSPFEALAVQLYISFFLGFAVSVPYLIRELLNFAEPGLYERELRVLRRFALPAVFLFYLGTVFSLVFLVGPMIEFLFLYPQSMGVEVYYSMERFVSFVVLFSLLFGAAFELPLVQYILAAAEMVRPQTWKHYWREALFVIVVFAAAVTPDGTGVTMVMVMLPLGGLYLGGYFLAKKAWNKNAGKRKTV